MRTLKYILIALVGIIITSCSNNLNLEPVSSISNASFWKTEGDAEGALNGMYSQFRGTFDSKTMFWGGGFRSNFYFWAYGGGAWDFPDFWENNLNPTTSRTNWSKLYILINDANLILKHVPGIEFNSESRKDEILGHAYFARGYTYFQLAKIWGDAPIALDGFESTEQELELSRSPVSEVLAQAKEDVEMAIDRLPAGSPSSAKNLANKTVANMLKADLYLWTAKQAGGGASDLDEAKSAVDAVLSAGYILEEDVEAPFRNEQSGEIIFSTFYSQIEEGRIEVQDDATDRTAAGAHPATIMLPGADRVPAVYREIVPTQRVGGRWIGLTDDFLQNVMKPASEDSRTDLIWQVFSDNGNIDTVRWFNKYIGEQISGALYHTNDVIIYRFAEAILFKAEIENALDNTGAALTELNKIAERAYGISDYYSGLSKEETDDAILDERILEFVCEGKSYHDIRRFDQAFSGRIATLVGREGDNNGNILLFPVNQDVINRNVKIIQTPGY
ncbi:MAG: RagB/SusD family nutrient uptake outer membrane protein [Cytophagales bacterium]|nr:RagB/SusD family nutrient uptake outer membrane protein [Cytophagales bacterium]